MVGGEAAAEQPQGGAAQHANHRHLVVLVVVVVVVVFLAGEGLIYLLLVRISKVPQAVPRVPTASESPSNWPHCPPLASGGTAPPPPGRKDTRKSLDDFLVSTNQRSPAPPDCRGGDGRPA